MPNFKSAREVAAQLLDELGMSVAVTEDADHPALAWRRAGLLSLCGDPDRDAIVPPVPLAAWADGAMLALKALADDPAKLPSNGAVLLGERARLMKLQRSGRSSPGGYCRLLNTADGRIAINLARDDDWQLLEVWLGEAATSWEEIESLAKKKSNAALFDQGIELGLPVALDAIENARPWLEEAPIGSGADHRNKAPLVVDLSSLWAGPMAGNLLHKLGAEVIKVESLSRPDGARRGNADFYNLLNTGKKSVAFDFSSEQGRNNLEGLIAAADIVIEASRPRALRQLGVDAEKMVLEKPGKIWVRLMAYGDDANRIGFGDDIGVSAGLCTIMERAWGEPCFVGDAIADPISGLCAALAAWIKWKQGGGALLTLSMVDTVRHAAQMSDFPSDLAAAARQWQAMVEDDTADFYEMRSITGQAEPLGASTADVMDGLC